MSETVAGVATSGVNLRKVAAPAAVGMGLAVASVYVATGNPYTSSFFPACPYLLATGHWCPGCGGLRATHELLNGDFAAAMGMNPVAVLVIIPLVLFGMAWWLGSSAGLRLPRFSLPTWAVWILPAFLGVFWIARNIPVLEPYLAP